MVRYRHVRNSLCAPDCPLIGKEGIRVHPRPGEPDMVNSVKVRLDGEKWGRWFVSEQLERIDERQK